MKRKPKYDSEEEFRKLHQYFTHALADAVIRDGLKGISGTLFLVYSGYANHLRQRGELK